MPRPEVLRNPAFLSYLGFRGLLTFALQMQAVVIGYHLYAITKDPLSLGLIGLAEAIPAISTALYAGYVADRSEKRGLLSKAVACMVLLSIGIGVAHYLVDRGVIGDQAYEAAIYGFIFLGGIARGFYGPAGSSLLGLLVPRPQYAQSSAWSSVVWQSGTVLGPTLGGFIYHWAGNWGPIASQGTVAACLLVGLVVLQGIGPRPPSADLKVTETVFESIRQGLAFVRSQRLLLGAISLDMLSVFFGGAVALLPIYAQDILHVGAEGLGMLRAADAVGSVAMMLLLTRLGPFERPWRTLLVAVAGFGCTIIGFGLSGYYFPSYFYLSLFWLIALGCFDAVSVVIRSTLMQTLTPDYMRGRVSSISSIFVASSNEIGSFESGFTARLMGTIPATLFGGGMTLLIVGAFSRIRTRGQDRQAAHTDPTLKEAGQLQEEEQTPPSAPGEEAREV